MDNLEGKKHKSVKIKGKKKKEKGKNRERELTRELTIRMKESHIQCNTEARATDRHHRQLVESE